MWTGGVQGTAASGAPSPPSGVARPTVGHRASHVCIAVLPRGSGVAEASAVGAEAAAGARVGAGQRHLAGRTLEPRVAEALGVPVDGGGGCGWAKSCARAGGSFVESGREFRGWCGCGWGARGAWRGGGVHTGRRRARSSPLDTRAIPRSPRPRTPAGRGSGRPSSARCPGSRAGSRPPLCTPRLSGNKGPRLIGNARF